jgi:hypothetical protein
MNQLAFPGLGTVMARRWTGYIQATLMVLGFCLFVGFMLFYFARLGQLVTNEVSDEQFRTQWRAGLWALWSGLGLCAFAWLWALGSSFFILRDASRSR